MKRTVHVVPQNTSLLEMSVVQRASWDNKQSIVFSVDDAAFIVQAGNDSSRVVAWEPERIGTGLTQKWFDDNYPGVTMEPAYYRDEFRFDKWPINSAYVTQPFGGNMDWYDDPCGHTGIDMITPEDRDSFIWAVTNGIVAEVGYHPNGWGKFVRVNHPGGFQTIYAHCSEIYVAKDEYVSAYSGAIARQGTTGNSTGVHVHLALKNFNVVSDCRYNLVDPTPYLDLAERR